MFTAPLNSHVGLPVWFPSWDEEGCPIYAKGVVEAEFAKGDKPHYEIHTLACEVVDVPVSLCSHLELSYLTIMEVAFWRR